MNWLKLSIFGAAIVLTMNTATRAQVLVDMSKITCEQMLRGTDNSIDAAMWISGYYNGLNKNTMLDLKAMKHNAEVVAGECAKDPKKTVMQTINSLLPAKKKK